MVTVPTSAGEIGVEELGVVLMHEHVFIRTEALQWGWPGFGGWDEEAEVAAARRRLARLKQAGVDAIVDVTIPGLGRDPALVARAAEGTGLRVLFATGYFAPDRLPHPFQFRGPGRLLDGDDRLLESMFERDVTTGIGNTGIRAAVLMVVTGVPGMTEGAERLARAVASVSARTGTVICTQAHAPTRRGLDQQRIFAEQGADLGRVLIGHCSETTDLDYLRQLIDAGSYIGWDGCGQSMEVSLDAQLDTLAELCWRGYSSRVMLAHDRASFTDYWTGAEIAQALPGWPHAESRGAVLPGLRDRGVPDDQIEQMLVRNPRDFLAQGGQAQPPARDAALARGPWALGAPAAQRREASGHPDRARAAVTDHGQAGTSCEPGSFAGRELEIGELRRLAGGARMVTLSGAGGIGKTRLLQELVSVLAGDYPDGAFLVALGDVRQPELVAARVASGLGVAEEPGVALAETLADALRGRQLLLALDGCDDVRGACAALCLRLLAGARGLTVVAASREALGIDAETVWPVPPLGLPAAGFRDPARAPRSDAVRLFISRVTAVVPDFALDAGNCAGIVAICRALAGLPLAIELAAARAGELGVAEIAFQLQDRLRSPEPESQRTSVRHRAVLRAAIGWTHGMLAPDEQVLLRRLSALASWSAELAERVCSDDGLPAARVRGLLAGLAERALVQEEPGGPGQARYRLPGAIRDYGAGRLAEAGEREMVHRRLCDYVMRLGEYMTSIGTARVPATWPVLQQVFRTCDADIGNIRAVLAWCLERGDAETGLRICAAVRLCWLVRGALAEGAGWLQRFLDTRPAEVPAAVRGPGLVVRAQLALGSGDLERAEAWAVTGLAQCQIARDPRFTAAALDILARTALAGGRPQEALRRATEAVQETRASQDWWNRGFALGSLASALAAMGCLAEARQSAETGLALMLEIDNQWGAAMFRLGLGDLARALSDPDTASRYYLTALPFVRKAMTASETARCLARLGRIALKQGDLGQARAYLADGLQLSLAAGSRSGIARGLLAFAALAAREGMPDRAVQLAAAATALCETAGLRPLPHAQTQRYLDAAGPGSAEAGRLWAAGRELTSREASRLALQPPAATIQPSTATAPSQQST